MPPLSVYVKLHEPPVCEMSHTSVVCENSFTQVPICPKYRFTSLSAPEFMFKSTVNGATDMYGIFAMMMYVPAGSVSLFVSCVAFAEELDAFHVAVYTVPIKSTLCFVGSTRGI